MRDARRRSARVLGGALLVLGLAMIVSTLARGGGPLAVGIFVGIGFTLLGALRLRAAGDPR